MSKSLRFISISHKTASVTQREEYHIPEEEKSELAAQISSAFPDISGLLLLVTCNRTEIYFESELIGATTLIDFMVDLKAGKNTPTTKKLFDCGDSTEETVRHLLKVTSGLASSVLGDAEIVHQIKKAYQFSIAHKMQGSLLERAMQTVFKSHKRISNETHFRDGTTSVAYKSLKVISDTYSKGSAKSKKILFIGAGDIVKQLFKYNSKFEFTNILISNRTEETAKSLAKMHQCKVYDWKKVLANDFEGFDVIISAASNCPQLIKSLPKTNRKVLLIDLALPSNIDKSLAELDNILFYDLDSISVDLEDTKEKRFAAIGEVGKIITEELEVYNEWLQGAPLRAFLAEHKIMVNKGVKDYFESRTEEINPENIKLVTDRIMRKLRKQTNVPIPQEKIEAVIAEQFALLE
ncbi:MAG: hypothetical protein WBM53_15845 [Maribacter sp.]